MNRRTNQKEISKVLAEDIRSGNLEKALRRAMQLGSKEPLGVVASAGIQAAMDMGGKEEIQLKMDEVLLEENSRVEKRIGFLAMFANVATLLSLLGTITGLIHSFAGIANANPAEKGDDPFSRYFPCDEYDSLRFDRGSSCFDHVRRFAKSCDSFDG